ncbi:MAG TPA: enolase C-terminal domain-like protein, partial [Candidatus Limnocylindrales bacterium]|nr:enolase C-terminal domain-like protein [Candidatus Limnocylindrales bacterium]
LTPRRRGQILSGMRIVDIEPILLDVPLREPVHGVHGVARVQRSVLVRVTSDAGLEGWGNVDPTPGYSAMSAAEVHDTVRRLGPALTGADPFNVRRALAVMDREAEARYEAIAAVEMALVDLKARALGVAVHSLLGGRVKDEVAFNAWIGTVPPAQAAREASAWLGRGFRSAKIKVSGAGPEGLARVAAAREAVGARMALRVDFNESLRPAEAVAFIRSLEPYDLTLVEQPISRDDIAGLAEIRRGIGIPLMADESVTGPASLIEIIRREAADLVKVKVMKQGGLLRTLAMVELAAAAGLRVVIGHGFGLTLSTLAEAAVASVTDAVVDGCEAVGPLKMAADVVVEPVRLDAGAIRLGDQPGLGATVDPDALKRYRAQP